MIKLAKEWWQLFDACFLIITGISMAEACLTLITYSLKDIFELDKLASIIASCLAGVFWYYRYKMVKNKNEKEQKKLDLEIKIREMYLNRKEMDEEIKEFLNNDM